MDDNAISVGRFQATCYSFKCMLQQELEIVELAQGCCLSNVARKSLRHLCGPDALMEPPSRQSPR
eukprot:scaffold145860_cov23-Tisochrysis_lutea.AAC.1